MLGLLTDRIIDELANGPLERVELRDRVIQKPRVSFQAFYKALIKLRTEEVVTVHRDQISLSIVWIQRALKRANSIAHAYQVPAYGHSFGGLKDGQKLSYRFKTLAELELFWTHAVLISISELPASSAILSLAPHYWYELLRPETTDLWYRMAGPHPHANVITHGFPEEKRLTRRIPGNVENMFNVNPLNQKESTYLTIAGDLLFEAHLDPACLSSLAKAVKGDTVDVQRLLRRPGAYRLIIQRNAKKSQNIRAKLQKYFSLRLSYSTSS